MTLKTCSSCKEEKDILQFSRHRGNKDGHSGRCKVCASITYAKTRAKYKESYAAKALLYNTSKRGFCKKLFADARLRARKHNNEFNLPDNYFNTLWDRQHGLCAVTDLPMQHVYAFEGKTAVKRCNDWNASPDRIDSEQGYVEGNVRLVCWFVNAMKSYRSDEEFRQFIHILAKKI